MFTNADCRLYVKQRNGRMCEYVPADISPVYWEDNAGQALVSNQGGSHGMSESNTVTVIIPESSLGGVMPKRDDKIARLSGGNEGEQLTVMSVSDFRFGSANVHHVEVTAK